MQVLSEKEKERYTRHLAIDGFDEIHQLKLKNAKVLIVGTGGLGSPVSLYLSAAGVGTLGLIDNDVVSLSNLQRQVLYNEDEIGISKIELANKKLKSQNNNVIINLYNTRFTPENAIDIAKEYDIVVDCTDNFITRYLIDEVCEKLKKPFVYGSISGFSGQVSVFHLNSSISYTILFPEKPEQPKNIIGVIGTTPAIIGSIQANEVIKIITGIGKTLSGKLLMINTKELKFDVLNIC